MKNNFLFDLFYLSWMALAAFCFTSFSLTSLYHILLLPPALYYFYLYLKESRKTPLSLSAKFLVFLISIFGLSILVNWSDMIEPVKNFFKLKYFLLPLLSIFPARFFLKKQLGPVKLKKIAYTFIFSTTFATLYGLFALYFQFSPLRWSQACHDSRACGMYGMYMTYGYGISLYCIALSILALEKKTFLNKTFVHITTVINLIGNFFSYTRGGWIGYAAGMSIHLYQKNKKLFIKTLGLCFLALILLLKFDSRVWNMFMNRSESNLQRIAFYQTALVAFKERPFLGWGYRNFEPHTPQIKQKYNIAYPELAGHAHNNYLEQLASTGILGLIATLGFLLSWLKECYQRKDLLGRMIFPVVFSFLVSGLFQYTFGDGENLFFIMQLWVLTQVYPVKT